MKNICSRTSADLPDLPSKNNKSIIYPLKRRPPDVMCDSPAVAHGRIWECFIYSVKRRIRISEHLIASRKTLLAYSVRKAEYTVGVNLRASHWSGDEWDQTDRRGLDHEIQSVRGLGLLLMCLIVMKNVFVSSQLPNLKACQWCRPGSSPFCREHEWRDMTVWSQKNG